MKTDSERKTDGWVEKLFIIYHDDCDIESSS
jgi:hypothetical protein